MLNISFANMAQSISIGLFVILFAVAMAKSIPRGHGFGIMGGELVNITELPHQVYIKWSKGIVCGGSIISPQHILTTASCVNQTEALSIVAGTDDSNFGGIEYAIDNITMYSKYDPSHPWDACRNYDIAIVKLKQAMNICHRINITSLADPKHIIKDGTELIASGWGRNEDANTANRLRKVRITKLHWEKCLSTHGKIKQSHVFCAGDLEGNTCTVDDGGPVIEQTSKGNVLVGVIEYSECSRAPSLFIKVSEFHHWIVNHITE